MSDTPNLNATDLPAELGLGGSIPENAAVAPTAAPSARPLASEAFGPPPRKPTAEEAFGPDPKAVAASTPQEWYEQHEDILHAFGHGAVDGWGTKPLGLDKDTEQWLKDVGIFNDYANGHASLAKSFNETLIRPAVVAADLAFQRLPLMVYGGAKGVAEMAAAPWYSPTRAIQIGAGAATGMMEAFPGGHFTGMPARIPLGEEIARAQNLGTIPPTAEQLAAERDAVRVLTPTGVEPVARPVSREPFGPPAPAVTGEPVPAVAAAPPVDIHAVARQIAPEAFTEFDDLAARRETLTNWIGELGAMRDRGTSPEIAALDRDIDALRGARLEAPAPERPEMANRITAMEEQRAKLVGALPQTGDTAEMATLRKDVTAARERMWDLQPQVSEAYRKAAAQGGEGAEAEAAPEVAAPAPAAEGTAEPAIPPTAAETPPEAATAPVRAAAGPSISGDVARQMVAAGRPQEEANAAGSLVQAYYETRAARFDGAKGTPEELYAAEGARIEAGRQRAREMAQPGELEQPAYHGSPFKFDKFTLDHIGKGEGAQAYGHGLYFAGSKEVAEFYRQQLAEERFFTPSGEAWSPDALEHLNVRAAARRNGVDLDATIARAEQLLPGANDQTRPMLERDLAQLRSLKDQGGIKAERGRLYHVDLAPAEDEYLDWDKPLSQQSEKVKAALRPDYGQVTTRPLGPAPAGYPQRNLVDLLVDGESVGVFPAEELEGKDLARFAMDHDPRHGKAVYEEMAHRLAKPLPPEPEGTPHGWGFVDHGVGDPRAASEAFRERGIRGIRYLDQGSRAAGEGTHNYVIFDPSDITIREFEQQRRGSIRLANDQARNTVRLFRDADASTFIHETGHDWLEQLVRDAADDRAPADLKADAATVRDYLGVDEGETIPTRAHEKFARSFERYMMEGVAPSSRLAQVFQQFKNWLTQIYQTVARLRAPINDDIRGVFDRMLAQPGEERPVIAPDREPTGTFADIHEADAEHTPPERAVPAAEMVRDERDKIAAGAAPEIEDERLAGRGTAESASRGRGGGGANAPTPGPATGPAGGQEGSVPQSGTERAGGGEPQTEGARLAKPAGPLIDRAGNIRLENLNTPEDVNAVIRDIAEANGEFITARRGVISDGEVMRLADAMGVRPQDLNLDRLRSEFTPERIMATRKLFVQTATDAQRLAAEAANGAPGAIMAYAEARSRLRMVQEYLSGLTAETGRGLRAFRRLPGMAEARSLVEIMGDLTENRTLYQLGEEARRVSRLDSAAKAAKYINDVDRPGLGSMVLESFVNALISGPWTHVGYAIGNELYALWRIVPETAFQAGVGAIQQLLSEEEISRVRFGEIGAQLHAHIFGTRKGFIAAWDSFKAGQTMPLPGEERASATTAFTQTKYIPNFFPLGTAPEGVPVIGGKEMYGLPLGTILRSPGERMIAPIHSYFRAVDYETSIAQLAYRAAANEGLEGAAFASRVADLTATPPVEMMQAARENATSMTLMSGGHGFSHAVSRFVNYEFKAPMPIGATRFLRFVDPFVSVSSTIMRQSVLERFTPLGALAGDIRADLLGRNGVVAQQTAMGRMGAGISLSLAAGGLAAEGFLIPSGPSDPKERAVWTRVFGMPHSVRIGGMSYDMSRLGVLGFGIDVAADLYYTLAESGPGFALGLPHPVTPNVIEPLAATEIAGLLVKSFGRNFLDEGFMRGPSQMMQALDDPDRYGASYVQNLLSRFVPFSIGMSQVASQVDPYMRQARTLLDSIKRETPWWSTALLPRRDIWGEPIPTRSWAGVYHEAIPDDPVDKALVNLGYYPAMPQRTINGVQLTDQQYDDLVRIGGRAAHMDIARIVQMPGFSAMPPVQQEKLIRKSVESWRENARTIVRLQSMGSDNDIVKKGNDIATSAIAGAPLTDLKKMRQVH